MAPQEQGASGVSRRVAPTYFDASTLVRSAEAKGAAPPPRSRHCDGLIQAAYTDHDRLIGVSRLSIIEFHNAVAITWRDNSPTYQQYDRTWAETVTIDIMGMVTSGRFQVVPTPAQAEDHALALVRLATREMGLGLHAWDAVHLVTASAWAHSLGEPVELWTTDRGFRKFVDAFPHFKSFVTVIDLNP